MNGGTRISWKEHTLKAANPNYAGEGVRLVYEAWRQEWKGEARSSYGTYRQAAGWYDDHDYDGERGFGPTLEDALADLLREEHRTEQRKLRPQPEGCRLSELNPR